MEENLEKKESESNSVNQISSESKGFGIAALVLGIVAIIFCLVLPVSIPTALLAVIFGIIGIKKAGKGMAIAGIVTGAMSIIIIIIFILFTVAVAKNVSTVVTSNEFSDWMNSVNITY